MTDHGLYEVLCTLAASGQLAALEKAEFDEHCLQCSACRDQFRDFVSVGVHLQLEAALQATCASMPSGSLERFLARAVREGIAPRATSARRSPSYALASAAAVLVLIVTLALALPGRRAAGTFAVSTTAQIPSRRSLYASVPRRALLPRGSKGIHTRSWRHRLVSRTAVEVNEASLTAERFPQAITSRYPFFGAQSATTPSGSNYSALSRSQVSSLDLFRDLDDFDHLNSAGVVPSYRPINIAAVGNTFDFAANIRQMHFQLLTAQ